MRSFMIGAALLLAATSVSAKAPVTPPEPAEHPDWNTAAQNAVAGLKASLYDPESAIFEWVSGFEWGYHKPVIGKRTFGWVACGNINARNRLGGYTGAQGFDVLLTPSGDITIYQFGDGTSTCSRGGAPINPELSQAIAKPGRTPALSVADELTKLADLLARGLINQSEFDAQKAKLLNP